MSQTINLFFAGDFVSKPTTTLIQVSDELRTLIKSHDYNVVNFEVPLRPDEELQPIANYERFYQSDDAPSFLMGIGFNLFSIATNHTFDCGDAGYLKTKGRLGESALGAGTREEAYSVKIVEKNGLRVGLLALCYASKLGVFDEVMSDKKLGCAYINDLAVNHIILDAKKKVDYLFVLAHDGIEYIDVPIPEVRARYQDFIDYGADAVIGTHPHCPQGWEEYQGKPIFYSLGNFFFNSKASPTARADRPHWYEGLGVSFELSKDSVSYKVVNIRNIGNQELVIDNDMKRQEDNDRLNLYLKDSRQYQTYLQTEIVRLWNTQEQHVIERFFSRVTVWKAWKLLLKKTLQQLRGKNIQNISSMYMLLKNDTRRNIVLRYLNQSKK